MMPKIVVYTRPGCPYCARAMALFNAKGAAFEEINAVSEPVRGEMIAKSGRSTYPQIFIGERHIGGCDDLHALDRAGGLDPLLKAA